MTEEQAKTELPSVGQRRCVREDRELDANARQPDQSKALRSTVAAHEVLEACGGDTARATEMLVERARHDAELGDEIMRRGCAHIVTDLRSEARARVWSGSYGSAQVKHPAYGDSELRKAQIVALAKSNLLAFVLPGGILLGEAKYAVVIQAADFFGLQSRGYGEKERWLRLIAGALPDSRTPVRAALDNDGLQALRLKAVAADAA